MQNLLKANFDVGAILIARTTKQVPSEEYKSLRDLRRKENMIKSMTGFGRGKYENDSREYIVEIKSVNHKYSDVTIKMPRSITYLEEHIKKEVCKILRHSKSC